MKANLTLFFLAMFLAAAFIGWDWPNIAKIMPVYVAALPGLILVLVQLYRDATGSEARRGSGDGGIDMDETYEVKLEAKTELRRTLGFFAWFVGGALGIWLLGIVITLPLLIFLYALVEGKEKWLTSLIMAACAYALVWGLFEYMLETRWPPGRLFG
ncbi:MAG: tripartite tricarboxylate transporter TctB family protein [Deltaproteobacteria bacterium]|nr:tripartite tricarboxylate transporter TctB family protein [Deltaproteobacteria bacterium]MDZ4344411.1 tripartite tricarboxylate transporter TctB family protein [Candidatus Binatia bacterium]